jgi:cytochrome P450 family 142 subfamily A polypeptide 1
VSTLTSVEDRIDLLDGQFWGRNPHEELTWLRRNAPVWRDSKSGVWAVSTYDFVKQVSTTPSIFSSAGGHRPDAPPLPMMIDMDGPAHRKRRKLVNRGFTPRRVEDQAALIRRTVNVLIDAVLPRGSCDLVWDLAAWLPLVVIGEALGVPSPDHQQLLEWSDTLLRAQGSSDPDAMNEMIRTAMSYDQYARQIIAARRDQPTEDLMSVLAHAEIDGDRLEDDEIVMESLLILIGGDETTRHVITGGAYQLLHQPQRWAELRAQPDLVPSAVEEMLRWVSPIKNMARHATTDVTLGDQHIQAGDTLLLLYPSANRDEHVFTDPFTFDIRRTPNDHVAFGFGSHFCLGNSLARLELRILFETLLHRIPDLALASSAEPAYRPANFVSGYESLPVEFTPRSTAG